MKKVPFLLLSLVLAGHFVSAQEPAQSPLGLLTQTLSRTEDPAVQRNILRGINAALKGKRNLTAPPQWAAVYEKLKASADPGVRQEAQALAATFGGGSAIGELRKVLADKSASLDARRTALESLCTAKDKEAIEPILAVLQEQNALRSSALRGLAGFDDPKIPQAILQVYGALNSDEKRDALGTLAGRLGWARALVGAIDQKVVSRSELSAPLARQLQDYKDAEIDQWLTKNWGTVRASSADKQKEIAKFKTFLTPANFEAADPQRGRALFSQTCVVCHTLFGTGGKIGPELTGAYNDVDYLLQNILDPNAIIGRDYQQTIVKMKDGQMLSGVVGGEDQSSITLKTLAGPIPVQKADVAESTLSPVSMMPEGLLSALSDDEIRDLFAYLRQHGQIPKLATPLNVNDFFSGTDLNGWHGSGDAWKIESGEIVGRASKSHPEFLVSELAAADFRLTAKVRVSGEKAAAEIAVRGYERDGRFEGASVSLGADAAVNGWLYRGTAKPEALPVSERVATSDWVNLEVVAKGNQVEVKLNGKPVLNLKDTPGGNRSVLAFHLAGEGAELRIREPKLELLQ